MVFVPSLTIILNVHLFGIAGIAVGTVLVTALEFLFVRLNLFQRHGWAYWMTFFGFPVFYCATCEFYRPPLKQGIFPGWIRFITRLSLVFNTLGLVRLLLAALQWEWTNLHILPTPIGNQALGRFIVYGLLSIPPGLWVISSDRAGRLFRLGVVTALLLTMNLGLEALRFHLYRPPWNGTFDALARGAAILVACLVDDWIVTQAGTREPRRAI